MAAVCGLDGRMRAGVQSAPALAGTAKFRRATEGCCRCTGASLFYFANGGNYSERRELRQDENENRFHLGRPRILSNKVFRRATKSLARLRRNQNGSGGILPASQRRVAAPLRKPVGPRAALFHERIPKTSVHILLKSQACFLGSLGNVAKPPKRRRRRAESAQARAKRERDSAKHQAIGRSH